MSIHGALLSSILLVLLPVIILQLLILNQMLPLLKWMLRIHRMFLLQLLLTPLSWSMFLILLSRNNQNLYCHLNLLPCLHPLRLSLQLRLLVLLLLPTVMFYSLPCHFRPNLRLHLLPVHRQRRPQGSIEPDLIAWLIPCVGLPMFQFCFVLLKRHRRAGLLRLMDLRASVSAVSQARHTLLGQANIY